MGLFRPVAGQLYNEGKRTCDLTLHVEILIKNRKK
jgi:hypothetical protein